MESFVLDENTNEPHMKFRYLSGMRKFVFWTSIRSYRVRLEV